MTFTLNSKILLQAFLLCAKGINQNNILPAASCYRLLSIEGAIEVSSCNLEISMSTKISSDISGIDVLIPAEKITKLLSSLPDQGIRIDVTDDFEITITALSGQYSMSGFDGKDFPTIKVDTSNSLLIPADDLSEAIYATSYARSSDQTQLKFTGLSVIFSKDKAVFAGCNLLVLSVFNIAGKFKPASLLLASGIVNAIPNIPGDCKISYSETSICFEYTNLTIKSLLMDEKYPDYKSIVPVNDTKITIDRASCLAATKRVLDFSNKVAKQINLSSPSGILTISGEDTSYKQKASETIAATGGGISIGINGEYFINCLSHFGSETLEITWSAFDKPILIYDPSEKENFAMIMAIVQG